MIGALLMLGIAIFGLCWLFGYGKPDRLVKFIIALIAAPIFIGILITEWSAFFTGLSLPAELIMILAVPLLLLFCLRVLFPNSRGVETATRLIWSAVTFVVTFPVRLLWRAGRQVAVRERNAIELERDRVVVGGRPPLRTERRRGMLEGRDD